MHRPGATTARRPAWTDLALAAAVARAGADPHQVFAGLLAGPVPDGRARWVLGVVTETGCPAADALDRAAAAGRAEQEAAAALAASAGGARATSRLLAALPLLALLLGGPPADVVGAFTSGWPGRACAAAAALLWATGTWWTHRLVTAAQAPPGAGRDAPGWTPAHQALALELTALAVAAGTGTADAAEVVARHWAATCPGTGGEALCRLLGAPGTGTGRAGRSTALHRFVEVLEHARTHGHGPVPVLRAQAGAVLDLGRHDADLRAARLAVRVVVPLGLCHLPAFLVLTLAPVAVRVLADLT